LQRFLYQRYFKAARISKKEVREREGSGYGRFLLTITLHGALGDNEMIGQQVRLWRWWMLGLEERLDG
jgi:hypothetical protein